MTTISAKVVRDSLSGVGVRLTTLQLRYPRFIHAESKTHRLLSEDERLGEYTALGLMNDPNLSRNARSSRAVPVERLLEEIENDPVVPLYWGANQRGMQASEECSELVKFPYIRKDHVGNLFEDNEGLYRESAWLVARDNAVMIARAYSQAGYHKQVVNRLIEPFMHIDTLVSATNWENFFALRIHEAAEPHMRDLAIAVRDAMDMSTPQRLPENGWHVPYVVEYDHDAIDEYAHGLCNNKNDSTERLQHYVETAVKVSVARCARISYAPFDGKADIASEIERHDKLVGSQPMHASPAEHVATPDSLISVEAFQGHDKRAATGWSNPHQWGNFYGWRQYRKMLVGESVVG